MARELKRYGHDVLVAGLGYNDPETIRMLVDWAEKIVVLQKELLELVPPEALEKVVVADVGPDVWAGAHDKDLVNRVKVIVDAWHKANWAFENFTLRPKPEQAASKP